METIKTEVSLYKCQFCGTLYKNQSWAEQCEDFYNEFLSIKESIKPWLWYILEQRDNKKQEFVFAYKVEFYGDHYTECKEKKFHIYDYSYRQYFESGYWRILDILTPREMFMKYKRLPDFTSEWEQGSNKELHYNMPIAVVEELTSLIEEYKSNYLSKLTDMDKNELIQYVVDKNTREQAIWGIDLTRLYEARYNKK